MLIEQVNEARRWNCRSLLVLGQCASRGLSRLVGQPLSANLCLCSKTGRLPSSVYLSIYLSISTHIPYREREREFRYDHCMRYGDHGKTHKKAKCAMNGRRWRRPAQKGSRGGGWAGRRSLLGHSEGHCTTGQLAESAVQVLGALMALYGGEGGAGGGGRVAPLQPLHLTGSHSGTACACTRNGHACLTSSGCGSVQLSVWKWTENMTRLYVFVRVFLHGLIFVFLYWFIGPEWLSASLTGWLLGYLTGFIPWTIAILSMNFVHWITDFWPRPIQLLKFTDSFGLFTEVAVCKFLRVWRSNGLKPFFILSIVCV